MTATAEAPQDRSYFAQGWNPAAWLLTTDHKRIAWLYLVALLAFFFVGGAAATLMRVELATPAADLVSDDTYNKLFTIHGIVMVWFFLIPSIPNVFGNFLIPLMIGARDLAFPRLNLASWYIFVFGGLCVMAEGRCSLSSYATGKSPNMQGVCSPPSHVTYEQTGQGTISRLGEFTINQFARGEAAGYPTLCKGRFSTDQGAGYIFEDPVSLDATALLAGMRDAGVTLEDHLSD